MCPFATQHNTISEDMGQTTIMFVNRKLYYNNRLFSITSQGKNRPDCQFILYKILDTDKKTDEKGHLVQGKAADKMRKPFLC